MNVKHISLSVFIPLYLAVAPFATHAAGVDGASAGADTITSTAWDPLESVTVTTGAGVNNFCMVVCSAEAGNPAVNNTGSGLTYRLAVTNNGVVVGGSERTFEFEAQSAVADVSWIEVSTTAAFNLPSNAARTMSCSARKDNSNEPNMTIQNSSMSIVCEDTELDNNPALPQVN